MDAILRDIRYGVRSLIKSPGVTLFATLALTLGIGVTTTMFSIVYGALMKGLPYADGARIVEVNRNVVARKINRMDMPWIEYFDYREQQHSFARMAAYTSGTMNVSGAGLPERYYGAWVSASFFDIMHTPPLLGRVVHRRARTRRSGAKVVRHRLRPLAEALRRRPRGARPGDARERAAVHDRRRDAGGLPPPRQRRPLAADAG